MNWLSQTLTSSLGKKLIMALTGLFLILFLTGHLLGNLQLLKDDGGQAFNEYAKFMTTTPVIKILSYLTYICIILHVIYSLILTIHNRKARPIKYAVSRQSENSVWTSRNMGILGTIVLLFLVIHLRSFWYEMHYGSIPTIEYEGGGQIKNLYQIVVEAFSQLWYVILYVVSMAALAFHLSHGFQSAFQTLGLRHQKYTPIIKSAGLLFAILVPALFALQPVYIYLKNL
ncbi:MAG: succinate dehydrogenase cytochrome b subunit [Bacteroidetes bacterium]|nr:succinate dehydrogenase cytochrome b subunit [Bacteroidota bacterium]MCH8233572.1 succinate dehydrogenase cytochrome b subunit [Bacteroidota bacterium]